MERMYGNEGRRVQTVHELDSQENGKHLYMCRHRGRKHGADVDVFQSGSLITPMTSDVIQSQMLMQIMLQCIFR